jgi:hypothetical protein
MALATATAKATAITTAMTIATATAMAAASLCRPNIWSAVFYFIYSYVNVYLTCI